MKSAGNLTETEDLIMRTTIANYNGGDPDDYTEEMGDGYDTTLDTYEKYESGDGFFAYRSICAYVEGGCKVVSFDDAQTAKGETRHNVVVVEFGRVRGIWIC